MPFILSSGTFNFDPELDPRKTKGKKQNKTKHINNDKSSCSKSIHIHDVILEEKSKDNKSVPLTTHAEKIPAVLTPDSQSPMKIIQERE